MQIQVISGDSDSDSPPSEASDGDDGNDKSNSDREGVMKVVQQSSPAAQNGGGSREKGGALDQGRISRGGTPDDGEAVKEGVAVSKPPSDDSEKHVSPGHSDGPKRKRLRKVSEI